MKKYILPLILIICLIFSPNALATAWDISTAVYAFLSKSVVLQETMPRGLAFSSDGTQMYTVGTNADTVFQYTLSTPWAVNTADYADKSKYVGGEDNNPMGVTFKPDGTRMYITSQWMTGYVHEYSLGVAWAVNTASHVHSKDIIAQDEFPNCTFFKPDGTKMYVVGQDTDSVYQYTLSTAWTISTATYDEKSVYVGDEDTLPLSLFFSSDGSYFYIVGTIGDRVYQYILSGAWDVSTADYDLNKYVANQATAPMGLAFSPDGSKMYVQGIASRTVFQYTLPVGWPHKWNTKEISKWNTQEIMKWNELE
jgi:sugar lactone lactonase YvrE